MVNKKAVKLGLILLWIHDVIVNTGISGKVITYRDQWACEESFNSIIAALGKGEQRIICTGKVRSNWADLWEVWLSEEWEVTATRLETLSRGTMGIWNDYRNNLNTNRRRHYVEQSFSLMWLFTIDIGFKSHCNWKDKNENGHLQWLECYGEVNFRNWRKL